MTEQIKAIGWAAWHPEHGFNVPQRYEGAIAHADLTDDLIREIRDLNADAGTNNRNGWRAAKVELVKVAA